MSLLPALTPTPKGAAGRFLLALDARPKLAFALLAGLSLWRLPDATLIPLALTGALLCFSVGGFARSFFSLWKGALVFVLVWAALKFLLDLAGSVQLPMALASAVNLGLRLATLLLLGLTLALSASPRRLGLGLAWFLRPALGRQAWRVALALALMLHFLPMIWATATGLNQGLSRRWPDCPWRERIRLIPQALLRVMSQTTWKQTLAVAARNLDQSEAWQPERTVMAWEWTAALIPGLVLLGFSMAG